jgi:hypothetical protein
MSSSDELFRGSYIDGCGVNLVDWCGLKLTNDQDNKLWGQINDTDLIERAGGFVDIEEQIDDAPPGMNDTYYSVTCLDEKTFKESLQEEIMAIVNG